MQQVVTERRQLAQSTQPCTPSLNEIKHHGQTLNEVTRRSSIQYVVVRSDRSLELLDLRELPESVAKASSDSYSTGPESLVDLGVMYGSMSVTLTTELPPLTMLAATLVP